MLVFIVPLRSPATCKDWPWVSRLCERSLRSLCQQTSDQFRVLLVCTQRPAMNFTHPALTIIEEDFPEPGEGHDPRERDKWQKLKRGLIAAREFAPAHIMFADADDCVHRDLAATCAANPQSPGWIFDTGHMWEEHSGWMQRRPGFHLTCGTSAMIRCEPGDLPRTMEDPREDFFMLTQGHLVIEEFMAARGTPLTPLPYPGAIYVTGTGENHSGIAMRTWRGKKVLLRKLLHSRPVTAAVRRTYGLERLPRTT